MRRSIAPLLVLLVASVATISILALAGPAGATPRSPHIVCPQEPHVVPCCPVPPGAQDSRAQVVCCTPSVCCGSACCPPTSTSGACCQAACGPSTPSITSSPSPSKAGQQVVVSGTAASGAEVALWRKLPRQSSFHQISTTTADGTGKYTFTLKRGTVMTNQEWYVTSNGAQSTTLAQEVDALVALGSSVRSTVIGRAVVLRGHVTPSHAGGVVLIEVKRGGTWHVIARPHLGRRSGYSVTHRFAKAGAVKLRVVLQSDSLNTRSTSSALTLTIKR
jgi:hypothetical protein